MFTEQGGGQKRHHIMFDLLLRRPSPWSTTLNKKKTQFSTFAGMIWLTLVENGYYSVSREISGKQISSVWVKISFSAMSRAAEYLERAEWGVGVWWLLVSGGAQNWPLWDMGKCLARTQRVLLCLLLITTERGSNHQHHQLHHHQHPYPHSWGGKLLSVNLNTLQT